MIAHPDLLHVILPLIYEVGGYLRHHYGEVTARDIRTKELNSLVSFVDETAERMLIDGLTKVTPEAGYITEEGMTEQAAGQDHVWVIDPLDGTTNYLHGIPVFSISIAMQEKDDYTLGLVYDVMQDDVYAAVKGHGAHMNQRPMQVSATQDLAESLIATGFPYTHFDHAVAYQAVFGRMMRATRGMRRLGSAALDLVYVASGRFDGYFEYGLNPWDLAAGMCILDEAGGRATSFHGTKVDPTASILASNGILHAELLEQMAPYRAIGAK